MHLVDDQMCSYEEFCELYDVEGTLELKTQSPDLLEKYMMQAQKMNSLMGELDNMRTTITKCESKMEESQQVFDELKESKLQKLVDDKVQDLYTKFTSEQGIGQEAAQDNLYASMLTHEQKLELMKQALSLDGTYQDKSIFDSFYAQDLIIFGINKNIPEAVRIGEKMMAENGASLSFEMARAIKNYQLSHSKEYQDAMKRTGPLTSLGAVYSNNRKPGTKGWNRDNSIVNMEDPYW